MGKGPAIYNDIRHAIAEAGGSDALADTVCTVVGDYIDDAVDERFSAQFREDDPPPRHAGMTETQASLRWCPFAFEVTALDRKPKDAAVGNRYIDADGSSYTNPAGCRCIGSMCLCWRWTDPLRGFCGLAGPIRYQPLGEPRRIPNRTPLARPTPSERADLDDE